jgi:hypothetical protein
VRELQEPLRRASATYLGQPGVVAVYIGEKIVGGERTGKLAIVFGVEKKLPLDVIAPQFLLPRAIDDTPTDVVELGRLVALGLVDRKRPCPGGYSIGHYRITAGTLGTWVKRGTSELLRVLSNNHVLADSNRATDGDAVLQPGPYDGGRNPVDRLGALEAFVQIRFEGADGGGKKKTSLVFWKVAKAVPNLIARLVGCPYRLVVAQPAAIQQPYPNLVDAALALPDRQSDVEARVERIGPVVGIRDLRLGDQVTKVGRTTERTDGVVSGVDGEVLVDYGDGRVARFRDQILISPSGFSAGGDSGSAILTSDGYLGGLLFAGSPQVTIANKIANVVALLGVRL